MKDEEQNLQISLKCNRKPEEMLQDRRDVLHDDPACEEDQREQIQEVSSVRRSKQMKACRESK